MQRQQAVELIRGSALAEHAAALEGYLSPSARIVVSEESEGSGDRLSASYFGGQPFLPENASWPDWDKSEYVRAEIGSLEKRLEALTRRPQEQPERIPGFRERQLAGLHHNIAKKREELSFGRVPLAFLGQISLREVSAVVTLPGWPREGVLAFFYDASQHWGFDPLDRGHCCVLFYPEEMPLALAEFPKSLADDARFPKRFLKLRSDWTLPTHLELDSGLALWMTDEYGDLIERLSFDSAAEDQSLHRVGGYPQEIQNDMRLECQLVTHGIYCGDPSGFKDPRRLELEKGAQDWELVLQFDSDEARLGWMWGDVGRVYFWARRQDIETNDFTNCWAILQCG